MREAFHGDLKQLGRQLATMCESAAAAMRDATRALLAADLRLAEQVLSADAELDVKRTECEEQAYSLLALQAPVARDLRIVLAATYCAQKIERMGDLAAHIADTARFTHPEHAVPAELADAFTELGEVAAGMADRLAALVVAPVAGAFAELEEIDTRVDRLHAAVLARISAADFPHGPQTAASLALVARFYERFGDQAVSVAKRLDFAATGETPTI
ncbi:phosphate signaling complex protein PhoU [Kutzneria sp. NPDC052558]|uniref:phosphate signaling complex protein PhoU n=1 Tax=Kutzneria sp. NPDC052558 TaxID=3364121 RepID=UPI0037CC374D